MRHDLLRRMHGVLATGLLSLPIAFMAGQSASNPPVGHITSVKGVVAANSPDGSTSFAAPVGTALQDGWEITTGTDSQAVVELPDRSTVQLNERSNAVFSSVANSTTMIVLKGGYASFRVLAERVDAYSVVVGNTTLTPQGAASFQAVVSAQRVQLSVQAGSVAVAAKSAAMTLHRGETIEFNPLTAEELATSHIRMVRLSAVHGTVAVRHANSTDWGNAAVGMPVQEGYELSTGGVSSAEVEFENGSSMVLGANSKMRFHELGLGDTGHKLDGVECQEGSAAFNYEPEPFDKLRVKLGPVTLTPEGKSEFRAGSVPGRYHLEVLSGAVVVTPQAAMGLLRVTAGRRTVPIRSAALSGPMTLRKGQAMDFHSMRAGVPATPQLRVVRLSFTSGNVKSRPSGSAMWQSAAVNLPILAGYELATSAASYAEAEFEDGSTARLGELSQLRFYDSEDGNTKLNGVECKQGYATFHFPPEQGVAYQVKVGDATLTPRGQSRFRADIAQGRDRVELFQGSVNVAAGKFSASLKAGEVLEREASATDWAVNVRTGRQEDAWDIWTEARDLQVKRTTRDQPVAPAGLVAGWSDLDTYGEWVRTEMGKIGWSPYTPAGWSPYTQGTWRWDQEIGWTWVSSEPWGWLPYHCGAWYFDASFGWLWTIPRTGCTTWEASRVDWYAGQDWIGWAASYPQPIRPPAGSSRRARSLPETINGQPVAATRPAIIVSMSAFRNQEMLTPQTVRQVLVEPSSLVDRPPFTPAAQPEVGARASTDSSSGAPPGSQSSAPGAVLADGDAAKEAGLLSGHRVHSENEPLRSRGGTTLGGKYNVRGEVGEFRGEAFRSGPGFVSLAGPRSAPNSRGVMVSHQSGGGVAHGGWTGKTVPGIALGSGMVLGPTNLPARGDAPQE